MSKEVSYLRISYYIGQGWYYPEELWFSVNLTNDDDEDIDAVLKVYRNGTFLKNLSRNENGVFYFTDQPEPSDSVVYRVVYDGSSVYEGCESSVTLPYNKGTAYGSVEYFGDGDSDVYVSTSTGETQNAWYEGDVKLVRGKFYVKGRNTGNTSYLREGLTIQYVYTPYDRNGNVVTNSKRTGSLTTNSNGFVFVNNLGGSGIASATLKLTLPSTSYYDGVEITSNLVWQELIPTATYILDDTVDVYYPDSPVVHARAVNSGLNRTVGGNFAFYVDNELVGTASSGENGIVEFVNPRNPKRYPNKYNYRVVFQDNHGYVSSEASKDVGYYRNQPSIVETVASSPVFMGEQNSVTVQFRKANGSKLSSSTLRYVFTLRDYQNNVIDTVNGSVVTNGNGEATFNYTANQKATGTLEWSYNGSTYYDVAQLTSTLRWKNTYVTSLSVAGGSDIMYPDTYSDTVIFSATARDSTDNFNIANKRIKIYRDDSLFTTLTTDGDGIALLEDTSLGIGTHTYRAEYGQNLPFLASSYTWDITREKDDTVTLTGGITNSTPIEYGTSINLRCVWNSSMDSSVQGRSVKLYRASTRSSTWQYPNGSYTLIDSKTTNSSGVVTFTDTPPTPTSSDGVQKYVYIFVYDGDDYHEPVFKQLTGVTYIQTTFSTFFEYYGSSVVYPDNYSETVTLFYGDNRETLSGKTVKVYRDNTFLFNKTTNSSGVFSFTDTGVNSGSHTYKVLYEGDGTYEETSLTWNVVWTPDNTSNLTGSITNSSSPRYGDTINISATYTSSKDSVNGKTIKLYRATTRNSNWTYPDGNYDLITSKTTDSQGKVTFTDTPSNPTSNDGLQKYVYVLVYDGNSNTQGLVKQLNGITYTNNNQLQLVSSITPLEINNQSTVKVKLQDNKGVLVGKTVTVTTTAIRSNGSVYVLNEQNAYKELTTDSNGIVTNNISTSIAGEYTMLFTYEDEVSGDVTLTTKVVFSKATPSITLVSVTPSNSKTEVTCTGTVKVKLLDNLGNPITNHDVKVTLSFKDLNNNTVSNMEPSHGTVVKQTDSNGMVTDSYKPTNRGDVKGTFTFTIEEDNTFKQKTFSTTIEWDRIETSITTQDLKHYAGRYTNLLDVQPDWTETSIGCSEDYTNIWSMVWVVNSNTSFSNPNTRSVLKYVNTNGDVLFTLTSDIDGSAITRWTRSYVGTSVINVVYEGNDLFKPSQSSMTVTTLARIQPKLVLNTSLVDGYGDKIVYNTPFNINATLTENSSGTKLSNQTVRFVIDDPVLRTTDSNGVASVNRYRPRIVGNVSVSASFNKDDTIDKYLPVEVSKNITIEQDTPTIRFDNLPLNLTNSCNSNASQTVNVTLLNSAGEPISDEVITWYENVGDSVNGNNWERVGADYNSTTNSNGKTSKSFPARSGVRLVRVIVEGNWGYKRTYATSYINYSLRTEYGYTTTIPVTNGLAEFTLDCKTPVGLYDLKIEYVNDVKSDGCKTFSDAVEYVGINRKKGTDFFFNTADGHFNSVEKRYEEEVTKQFEVKAWLHDENNVYLASEMVDTSVDNLNHLLIKSDANGLVVRHHANNTVDDVDSYVFKYEQTRKNAGITRTAKGYTLPLKPLFSYINPEWVEYGIDDEDTSKYWKQYKDSNGVVQKVNISQQEYETNITILNYEEVEFPVRGRAYYYTRKYDKFGEEVHKNSQGDVYKGYTSLGEPTYYIWNGTTKTTTTKQVYDQAERYHVINAVKSSKMCWRSGTGTLLTSGDTDNAGIGNGKYHRHTIDVAPMYINIKDNKYFDPTARGVIYLDTHKRLVPILSNNMSGTQHYKIPCKINCTIKDPDGTPLKDKTIKFKYGGKVVGTGNTNANGYCEVTYIPPNGRDFKYQCIFDVDGIYAHTDKVFTVPCDKQYPLVAITPNPLELEYGENLTLTTKLYERPESSPNKPMVGYKMQLFMVGLDDGVNYTYDNTTKTLLGVATTGNDGLARLTVKPPVSGKFRVWSFYYGDYRDKINQEKLVSNNSLYHWAWNISAPVTVNKKEISFVDVTGTSCEGFAYGTSTIRLVDKDAKPLTSHSVLVQVLNSSGTSVRKYNVKTDSNGKVGVKFVGTAPSTSFTNILPVNIGQNNVNTQYTIKYSFNTSDTDCVSYPHYLTVSKNVTYKFTKAYTMIKIEEMSDDTLSARLIRKIDGINVASKPVQFVEGSNVLVTRNTDSNGLVTVGNDDITVGGDHKLVIKFVEDNQYYGCQTSTKWTNVIVDDCTDLATFTTKLCTWYSTTSNTRKYGSYKLRNYCKKLKKNGSIDDEYGVHAPTGVVMQCNSIHTTNHCDISFMLRIVSNRSDGQYGGHFGLMRANADTAEGSPMRYEIYRQKNNNPYSIINNVEYYNNGTSAVKRFKMNFQTNKWYYVKFEVRSTYVTVYNLTEDGKVIDSYKRNYTNANGTTVTLPTGLNPYIFTFLDDCEMIIRQLKMEQK